MGTKRLQPLKMDHLKPISHKEFNKFIKGKGFKGRKDYTLKDLKAKFGFKPLVERIALVIFFRRHETYQV